MGPPLGAILFIAPHLFSLGVFGAAVGDGVRSNLMGDPVAILAIILSSIGLYCQFFRKERGVSLTLLSVEAKSGHFAAKLCITNTGDTPVVITELIPLLFDSSHSGGPPGNDCRCAPPTPVSVPARSHYLAELRSSLDDHSIKLYLRETPDLIPKTDSGFKFIVGGVTLSLITEQGKKAWAMIQLFQLGLRDGRIVELSYIDRPINLFKYKGLRIANE